MRKDAVPDRDANVEGIAFMGLVLLLKDFVQPVTVVSALVLSVLGAFLALFVAGARSR